MLGDTLVISCCARALGLFYLALSCSLQRAARLQYVLVLGIRDEAALAAAARRHTTTCVAGNAGFWLTCLLAVPYSNLLWHGILGAAAASDTVALADVGGAKPQVWLSTCSGLCFEL
jgi:hypothetical protein